MLTEQQLASLSPLAQAFRARFRAELGHVAHTETFTNRYELAIPPAHPDVGVLRVYDDHEELTLGLGEHHHWHVSLYHFDSEPPETRVAATADAAVESVRALLEHRTILRLSRRQGRVTGSTTYAVDYAEMPPPGPEDSEYVWAGPRVRML